MWSIYRHGLTNSTCREHAHTCHDVIDVRYLRTILQIGKPNAFTCVFNGATGTLGAKVVAPSGAEDEALIQALDDTNSKLINVRQQVVVVQVI